MGRFSMGKSAGSGMTASAAFAAAMAATAALVLAFVLAATVMLPCAGDAWAQDAWAQDAWAKDGGSKDVDASQMENTVNPQQLPDSSFIYDTSIYDLNTSDTYYDKQTVQITGEAVGDLITSEAAESKCWITVSALEGEPAATIQAYVSKQDAEDIDTFGRYGSVGSTVIVKGTFNLVCSEHDGLSDIHADSMAIAQKGYAKKDKFAPSQFLPGILLVLVGLGLVIYYRTARERMR